jgi:iron complex transport system substrate-binding protein
VYLPASVDIAGIASDVMKIAALTGREKEGEEAVRRMNAAVDEIRKIARTIPEEKKRTVVFELESAPYIYSFGDGVYLDEILEAAGAINAFKKERGWISVSAESVIAANPDVILTNVASAGDPVAEIASRPGWNAIKAVKNGRIYKIDNMTSSQCAPAVVRALREIAEAVYPEYYR